MSTTQVMTTHFSWATVPVLVEATKPSWLHKKEAVAALTGSHRVPVTVMDVPLTLVVTTVTMIRPVLIPGLPVPSSSETAVRVCARTPEQASTWYYYTCTVRTLE